MNKEKENKIETGTKSKKALLWKYITAAAIIIGILGSLAEIFNFIDIIKTPTNSQKYQLTVYVTDAQGNVPLEHIGEINTSIGNRPMRETIGEDGRSNFGDIPLDYLGDSIKIGFNAKGWELADKNNVFVFNGEPITLKIKRDNSLGVVKGMIKSRDGQHFIDYATIMINSDTIINSDSNGLFQIILPEEMQVKSITEGYKLTFSKKGYKTVSQYYYPKSSAAEIRLEKEM